MTEGNAAQTGPKKRGPGRPRKTPEGARVRRGPKIPKVKKREPEVGYRCLTWPKEWPRTKERVTGSFRLKYDARKRAQEHLSRILKRMDVPYAAVSWTLQSEQDAVNHNISDPGVAIRFKWQNKARTVRCDYHTTVVANLRACVIVIESVYNLHRVGAVQDVDAEFEHFQQAWGLAVQREEYGRMPTIQHEDPLSNWQKILEIPDDQIYPIWGIPRDLEYIKKHCKGIVAKYHPDKPDSPDDDGKSFMRANDAYQMLKLRHTMFENALRAAEEDAKRIAEEALRPKKTETETKKEESEVSSPAVKTEPVEPEKFKKKKSGKKEKKSEDQASEPLRSDLDFSEDVPEHIVEGDLTDEEMQAASDAVENFAQDVYDEP